MRLKKTVLKKIEIIYNTNYTFEILAHEFEGYAEIVHKIAAIRKTILLMQRNRGDYIRDNKSGEQILNQQSEYARAIISEQLIIMLVLFVVLNWRQQSH